MVFAFVSTFLVAHGLGPSPDGWSEAAWQVAASAPVLGSSIERVAEAESAPEIEDAGEASVSPSAAAAAAIAPLSCAACPSVRRRTGPHATPQRSAGAPRAPPTRG